MKKVIFLLLMGLFLFPAMELLAQQQVQSQTQIHELGINGQYFIRQTRKCNSGIR